MYGQSIQQKQYNSHGEADQGPEAQPAAGTVIAKIIPVTTGLKLAGGRKQHKTHRKNHDEPEDEPAFGTRVVQAHFVGMRRNWRVIHEASFSSAPAYLEGKCPIWCE